MPARVLVETVPLTPWRSICHQRYTGVKVKFKPSTIAEAAAAGSSSDPASSGGGTGQSAGADGSDASSSAGGSRGSGVKCGGQELAFTTAQQGEASDTREIFIGLFCTPYPGMRPHAQQPACRVRLRARSTR